MTRLPAAAAALLSALTLAACSSSSNSSASSNSSNPAPPPAGQSSTAGSSAGTGSAPSAAPASGAATGNLCGFLAKNNQLMVDIGAGDSKPGGVDRQQIKRDLQNEVDQAPSGIKGDLQTIVQFDVSILDGGTSIKETPALQSAMKHYISWVAKNCAHSSVLTSGATP